MVRVGFGSGEAMLALMGMVSDCGFDVVYGWLSGCGILERVRVVKSGDRPAAFFFMGSFSWKRLRIMGREF